eukprot:6489177-Prymnesium_polylepis.1
MALMLRLLPDTRPTLTRQRRPLDWQKSATHSPFGRIERGVCRGAVDTNSASSDGRSFHRGARLPRGRRCDQARKQMAHVAAAPLCKPACASHFAHERVATAALSPLGGALAHCTAGGLWRHGARLVCDGDERLQHLLLFVELVLEVRVGVPRLHQPLAHLGELLLELIYLALVVVKLLLEHLLHLGRVSNATPRAAAAAAPPIGALPPPALM